MLHTLSHRAIPVPKTEQSVSTISAILTNTTLPSIPEGAYVHPCTTALSIISAYRSALSAPFVHRSTSFRVTGNTCLSGGLACRDRVWMSELSSSLSIPILFIVSTGSLSIHPLSTVTPRPRQSGSQSSIITKVGGTTTPTRLSSSSEGRMEQHQERTL